MLPSIKALESLYVKEQLSLSQIAKRFGTSKQAVHWRLVRAGVKMRPRAVRKTLDVSKLRSLLIEDGLTFEAAAQKLGVSLPIVSRTANAIGLGTKKYRCRAIPALNTINVGDALTFRRTKILWEDYLRFYEKAAKLGIKLSVESLDDSTIRVTRTQ